MEEMNLFNVNQSNAFKPLAERMRPRSLEEFCGQEHILGKGKLLYRLVSSGAVSSCIFFGPPG
ncbi:MAG: replication-associated recombination protein A, partial [Clostridia bacterium]|nr:replication-associated recombination protein A [Clostridia bacterium]